MFNGLYDFGSFKLLIVIAIIGMVFGTSMILIEDTRICLNSPKILHLSHVERLVILCDVRADRWCRTEISQAVGQSRQLKVD